jgi:hypothetical protein
VEKADGSTSREAVVTADLKAIVFLQDGSQVKPDGVEGLNGIVTGIELLKGDDFQEKLRPYLGKATTMAILNKISRDVIEYYRRKGFPVVNVVVPKQTVRDGVVQFVVTEAIELTVDPLEQMGQDLDFGTDGNDDSDDE